MISDPKAEMGVVVVSKNGYRQAGAAERVLCTGTRRSGRAAAQSDQSDRAGDCGEFGTDEGLGGLDGKGWKTAAFGEVPVTNRANRGEKLVELNDVAEVVVL